MSCCGLIDVWRARRVSQRRQDHRTSRGVGPAEALISLLAVGFVAVQVTFAEEASPLDIGSRREIFVDDYLVGRMSGTSLKMHSPQLSDACSHGTIPLGAVGQYAAILKDGDLFRLYCRGEDVPGITWKKHGVEAYHRNELTFYAESRDGLHWAEPNLGLYQFKQYPRGNVLLAREIMATHNFTPFIDTRAGVSSEERYKAMGGLGNATYRGTKNPDLGPAGLRAFVSPDGIHWRKVREEPVIPGDWGALDSMNVAFWSEAEKTYVCYFRTFASGLRSISRTTSQDFLNWTEPTPMNANLPGEHLYTNGTMPYFRAPHIYIALPTRFHAKRGSTTDIMLMSSRGGARFDRTFRDAYIRPGLGEGGWGNRSNYAVLGVLPTSPHEMSIYVFGNRRYVLRTDGFSSVNAPYEGGEMVTKLLTFTGDQLSINYATSAGGQVLVEVQDSDGNAIPGYSLEECKPLIGDQIDQAVAWSGDTRTLGSFSGKPVRVRFVMEDADLYSICFQ